MSSFLKYQLYDLYFGHPKESRFKSFFKTLKTKKRKTMLVHPKNISLGLDKRTSIIIKNIPDDISSEQFMQIITNFSPYIDYFYNILNIKTRKNLRVAFVNVTEYKQIIPIYMGLLYKMKFKYERPDVKLEICYSKKQGKTQLIQRFLYDKKFLYMKNQKKK